MTQKNPYGDDAGTRVGQPSTPDRNKKNDAGNEAARGIHGDKAGGSSRRPGSEPSKDHKEEHTSGYGGEGGKPKPSADQQ